MMMRMMTNTQMAVRSTGSAMLAMFSGIKNPAFQVPYGFAVVLTLYFTKIPNAVQVIVK